MRTTSAHRFWGMIPLCLLVLLAGCVCGGGRGRYPSAGTLPRGDEAQEQFARGEMPAGALLHMWLVFFHSDETSHPGSWEAMNKGKTFVIQSKEEQSAIIDRLRPREPLDDTGGLQTAALGALVAQDARTGRYLYFTFRSYETHMWISPPSHPGEFGTHGRENTELWRYLRDKYPTWTHFKRAKEQTDKWIRTYYRGGALRGEFPLKNGKPHGVARLMHSNGMVNQLVQYKNGVVDGVEWSFAKSGRLMMQMSYRDGVLHGVARVFEENGTTAHRSWFWKGQEVTEAEFEQWQKTADAGAAPETQTPAKPRIE